MSVTLYTLQDAERIIARGLHKLRHFETIIGVPRSGAIFAAFIATQLGVSLADVDTAARSSKVLKHGHAERGNFGRMLLVEDVVNSGKSLADAFAVMAPAGIKRDQVTTCSIWTNPGTKPGAVDIDLGGPHAAAYLFSWQAWHSARWPNWATDMDGVLCEDWHGGTEDEYRAWTTAVCGRWLPRPRRAEKWPIGAIITSRPEGVRAQTHDWLTRHGITYRKLIMAPGQTQADVIRNLKASGLSRGEWKAREAAKLGAFELFIESDPKQAAIISRSFPHLVWCTDEQQRYRGGMPCGA